MGKLPVGSGHCFQAKRSQHITLFEHEVPVDSCAGGVLLDHEPFILHS